MIDFYLLLVCWFALFMAAHRNPVGAIKRSFNKIKTFLNSKNMAYSGCIILIETIFCWNYEYFMPDVDRVRGIYISGHILIINCSVASILMLFSTHKFALKMCAMYALAAGCAMIVVSECLIRNNPNAELNTWFYTQIAHKALFAALIAYWLGVDIDGILRRRYAVYSDMHSDNNHTV